jgi:ABC-type Fe3+/spermidine/putrescine transport system ATPase subunit
MPAILALDGVVKRYGSALGVGPVSLDVAEGEFLTLLGPSGCGKTTTLHIIAGLLQPDEGAVRMDARDITRLAPPYRDMGVVFQSYALFPHKSVFDNVAFGLRMRKAARDEIRRRVTAMLGIVGLPGVEDRYPDQLSGGQRQRVALARALVIEPRVLLLDEPLSNLDALLRKRMRLELRDIQRRLGITTIFVTHDQEEAFEMSDRVVLLNQGHIEQLGAPEDLYNDPASRFAAEFIGEASLLDAEISAVADGRVEVALAGGGALAVAPPAAGRANGALAVGARALVLVRPERVTFADPGAPGALRARIDKRVFSGEVVLFELTTEGGQKLLCKQPSVARFRALAPGQWVGCTLEEARLVAGR